MTARYLILTLLAIATSVLIYRFEPAPLISFFAGLLGFFAAVALINITIAGEDEPDWHQAILNGLIAGFIATCLALVYIIWSRRR